MNFRTTLFFLAFAAGLFAFIYFYESKLPTADQKVVLEKKLLSFKKEDITQFQIQLGNTLTVCVRKDEGWALEHPLKTAADPEVVSDWLWELGQAQYERAVELSEPFGEPRAELTVWVKKHPTRVLFGENTPLGNNLYVKIEGQREVRVVPASVFAKLIRNAEDLRDKRIFDFDLEQVMSLTVRSSKGKLFAEKQEGQWWAGGVPCDAAKAESYLYRLKALRVLEFLNEAEVQKEAQFGLDKPQVQIEVTSRDNKTGLLKVGKMKDKEISVYAQGGQQANAFALSLQEVEPLKVTMKDFQTEEKEKP